MGEMRVLRGMGVSGGVAIGHATVLETRVPHVVTLTLTEEQIEPEVVRLHEAADEARLEIERIRTRVSEDFGNELAGIFDAHALLLTDRKFIGRVEERIRSQRMNAEWAVNKTAE